MSERLRTVQRPQSFKDWFAERYPDYHHRPHVGRERWFTGSFDETSDQLETVVNALSEYLDEQFTEEIK